MKYLYNNTEKTAKEIITILKSKKILTKELANALKDLNYKELISLKCDILVEKEYYVASMVSCAINYIILRKAHIINKAIVNREFIDNQLIDDYDMLIQIRFIMWKNIRYFSEKTILFLDEEIKSKRELTHKLNND